MHKRLMLLATLNLIDAAIARMAWLPFNQFPASYLAVHGYLFVLMLPALVHDWLRHGSVHRGWRWGLLLMVPWVVAAELAWDAPWWQRLGPLLIGA